MFKRLWEKLMSYLAMNEETSRHIKLGGVLISLLGDITIKYEGTIKEPGIIIDNPDDPGGKSYGPFQLSLNAGTLGKYIQGSQYAYFFKGLTPGSNEFDKAWLDISKVYGREFMEEQREYIKKKFFVPAERYAKQQGFSTELRAIQEALFSIAVQHGGYKSIIKMARKIYEGTGPKGQIKALYTARNQYVQSLHTLPDHIKSAIYNRYKLEYEDILNVYDAFDA